MESKQSNFICDYVINGIVAVLACLERLQESFKDSRESVPSSHHLDLTEIKTRARKNQTHKRNLRHAGQFAALNNKHYPQLSWNIWNISKESGHSSQESLRLRQQRCQTTTQTLYYFISVSIRSNQYDWNASWSIAVKRAIKLRYHFEKQPSTVQHSFSAAWIVVLALYFKYHRHRFHAILTFGYYLRDTLIAALALK